MCMSGCYEYLRKNKGWHSMAKIAQAQQLGVNGNTSVCRSMRAIMFYGDIYAKIELMDKHFGTRTRQLFCHERWIQ